MAAQVEFKIGGDNEATAAGVWGLLTLLRVGPSIAHIVTQYMQNNVTPLIAGDKGGAIA